MDQTNPVPLPDPVTLLDELEPVLGERAGEPVALDGGITNRNYRVRDGESSVSHVGAGLGLRYPRSLNPRW